MPTRIFFLVLALILSLSAAAAAESASGTISGFVYDASDGEALINATVTVTETGAGTLSNNSGYFVLTGQGPGTRTVACTYVGYAPVRQAIIVGQGDNKLRIELQPEAVVTAEVIVRADSMRTGERLFQKAISQITLAPRQINAIPQVAEADLLRSLHSLPGILPLSDFSSALYVRGGTPDQNRTNS